MYEEGLQSPISTALQYAQKNAECALRVPTTREKLLDRKAVMERHLADINAALDALDKFPEFENIHNLLSKAQI
jgi:hypothetical protein